MKSPSVKSVRVPGYRDTLAEKCPNLLGHSRPNPTEKTYGRVPAKVCADPDLTAKDVRVYAALGILERGGVVNSGVRWIAECCAMGRSDVSRSIAHLVAHGHVDVTQDRKLGSRQQYTLSSQVFRPRSATVDRQESRPCARCSKMVYRVAATGLCRSCVDVDDLSARVVAAQREIGSDATPAQIAAHLKNEKLTRRIARLLEKAA